MSHISCIFCYLIFLSFFKFISFFLEEVVNKQLKENKFSFAMFCLIFFHISLSSAVENWLVYEVKTLHFLSRSVIGFFSPYCGNRMDFCNGKKVFYGLAPLALRIRRRGF